MRDRSRVWLLVALVAGVIVRLGILLNTSRLGTEIIDEQHYVRLADNLVAGNGFAWGPGAPTSIRPPLYPALLAGVWQLAGVDNLQAVRLLQMVLAAVTCALVYLLGTRLYNARVGRIAAALCWVYPSLIFFNVLILTETLFTLFFVAFVLLAVMVVQTPRVWTALGCGVALGLSVLTRSVLWPLPLLLCPLLALFIKAPLARRLALPLLVVVGYAVVVAPWAVRNTRLQGVFTVVDTMGGINLRMGNYEYTPDDRMWDAVALTGEKSWVYGIGKDLPGADTTEGRKEKWAQQKALQYMRANPGVTAKRSLIKFADFWGLEREFMAGIKSGLFAPPEWFGIAGSIAIVLAYVLLVTMGAAGVWLAPPADWKAHLIALLPLAVIVGAHTIVFGHSRYHVPLMPILGVYGAAMLQGRMPALSFTPRRLVFGATVTVTVLAAIWIRQVVLVDLQRITALLNHVG